MQRSFGNYGAREPPQTPLRARLRELAAARVSYGSPRLYALLLREGWRISHQRVERLYAEGRHPVAAQASAPAAQRRRPRPELVAQAPKQIWAMDFLHDTLADGPLLLVLTLIDSYHPECLALIPQSRVNGADVTRVHTADGAAGGLPAPITVDNGSEFTSRALDAWAY